MTPIDGDVNLQQGHVVCDVCGRVKSPWGEKVRGGRGGDQKQGEWSDEGYKADEKVCGRVCAGCGVSEKVCEGYVVRVRCLPVQIQIFQ